MLLCKNRWPKKNIYLGVWRNISHEVHKFELICNGSKREISPLNFTLKIPNLKIASKIIMGWRKLEGLDID
jgi:hypothetical protein